MNPIGVLLAEDHLITRQGICRLLESEKRIAVVGEANNGNEAVRLVEECRPDVVIMDVAMPGINGIEATRQIKRLHPEIAVLILTAYDDDEYIFGLLEAGAAGYLLKTADGDELIRAILAVQKGEPVLDPIVARKVIERAKAHGRENTPTKISERLTEREMEVLRLAANGLGNRDIAERLQLSRRTVEGILRTIFNKLGVGSRVEAVLYALRKGWFTLQELP
jgi:NarL family two-component system response regulator LiaR